MKRFILASVLILLFSVSVNAAEEARFTVPVIIPDIVFVKVDSLVLEWGAKQILIIIVDSNGVKSRVVYHGTEAVNLMKSLNKADLSVKSLNKRILQKLVVDGKIPNASVTGTVD